MSTHKYYLGKCDGHGNGRKSCEAYINWDFNEEEGTFSANAEVWNSRKTDVILSGRCVDWVAAFFPDDKKAQAILKIWKEWNLNYLTAGSPAQMEFLKAHKAEIDEAMESGDGYYSAASYLLAKNGLNPDFNYPHNGKSSYAYASAWLTRELPADVIAEIKSWSAHE